MSTTLQQGTLKIPVDKIGFDIDGVVADTMEAFLRLAGNDYGINSISVGDITEFQVEDCLDMESSLIEEIFNRLLYEPVESGLAPMRNCVCVLQEFARTAPLTFITARPDKEPIGRWLEMTLGSQTYKKTRLVATGEHDGKAEYIKEMGLRYFVDDRADTCLNLTREEVVPIVYDQPWNRGKHSLFTVTDWLAIRSICCEGWNP